MSVLALARAVRERRGSPVALVEHALAKAKAWQPVTNAFSQLHPEEALAEAHSRAEAVARGDPLGPLHGVPAVVKDLFDVAGWETTGCCEAYRGNVARSDAEAVRRLREAGAVIIGKTNQHELACGGTNLLSACGPARNPWDPSRITGGSSGGSAAAVAAGVVPLALGSDTGGSIRIPASLCGVVGLKTTHGRVSLDGVMPLAPSMDTVGPLTRSVEDAALAFAVLTGESPEPFAGGLEGLRVGELGTEYLAHLHPEVLRAVTAAVGMLRDRGADTVAVTGDACFAPDLWQPLACVEFARHHGHLLDRTEVLHRRTVEFLERGVRQEEEESVRARRTAGEVREGFLSALSAADVLLAAATPFPAPPMDAEWIGMDGHRLEMNRGVSLLTRSVNIAGLPALSLPAGWSSEGLPIGIQLIGRPGEEATLLGVGRAFQDGNNPRIPAVPRRRI